MYRFHDSVGTVLAPKNEFCVHSGPKKSTDQCRNQSGEFLLTVRLGSQLRCFRQSINHTREKMV